MSHSPEFDCDDDPIEDAAALWLLKRSEGMSAHEANALDEWLSADPRHAEAFKRLEQTCAILEEMPLVESALRVPDTSRPARISAFPTNNSSNAPRGWMNTRVIRRALFAAAAMLVIGFTVWWQWQPALPVRQLVQESEFATVGEGVERIALSDGSMMELNAESSAAVHFNEHQRRVVLQNGEAYFTVAHDVTRPFVVEAAGVSMRAVGTAFNVRIVDASVELLVTDGKVRLEDSNSSTTFEPARAAAEVSLPEPTLVQANQRAVIATLHSPEVVPLRLEEVGQTVIREALAWQQRMLVFKDAPLSEAAAQFNRHSRIQLRITDDALASRLVAGTFAGDNVESFVRLLANDPSVVVERPSPDEIVLRQAP